ncbi:hypothetical protein, partial [Kluyvera georgiana]|uniref:hypothetical protein n=1 Tax=Kluyvera georgiana TaxID=73098 RepID=UPI00322082CE
SDISNSHNALLIMLNFFSESSARQVSIDKSPAAGEKVKETKRYPRTDPLDLLKELRFSQGAYRKKYDFFMRSFLFRCKQITHF